jgi:hypothetical protein
MKNTVSRFPPQTPSTLTNVNEETLVSIEYVKFISFCKFFHYINIARPYNGEKNVGTETRL